MFQRHGYLSGLIIDEAEGMPSAAACAHRFGSLIRAYQTVGFTPDITVALRIDETNQAALDYYLLPRLDFGQQRIHLADHNGI